MKDELFTHTQPSPGDFCFDERVARVFPDMIRRSVPGYQTVVELIGSIAARHVQPDSRVYDLGCSLGSCTLSMYSQIGDPSVQYVALDNSGVMLEKCRSALEGTIPPAQLKLVERDVERAEIRGASVVVMNFTLQFVAPECRQELLDRIYRGLLPGGALVLSEKIRFRDPAAGTVQEQLHQQFKKANGYSEMEISRKRSSLEKIMILDDLATHEKRLTNAGFGCILQWFQSFNFVSVLALK
ncbi:MAG: carboxy-S-adenosyl-L-methionine synthase CmoA [Gammaproteobacteria bacterium]|nr:carboxy-S-adenosyl-L-methionine synthase CmoA [Gammaproteobacteria bacterium]